MLTWDILRPIVLGSIAGGEIDAVELRARLTALGADLSSLAFFGMMGALERTGLVTGKYADGERVGDPSAGRSYRLTSAGMAEWLAVPEADAESYTHREAA